MAGFCFFAGNVERLLGKREPGDRFPARSYRSKGRKKRRTFGMVVLVMKGYFNI